MQKVDVSEEVPLSADAVWALIGNFFDLSPWATIVVSTTRVEDADGVARIVELPGPNGNVKVREKLLKEDRYGHTFEVVGSSSTRRNYICTTQVVPVDAGRCRIEYHSTFEVLPGVNPEDEVAGMTKFYRGNIKAMKRALKIA